MTDMLTFSIYALRDDPDFTIFDRELAHPPVGEPHEYDCVGVFQVEGAEIMWQRYPITLGCKLVAIDEWQLGAQSILCHDWTDRDSGNTAGLTQLWPCEGEDAPGGA